MFETKCGSVFEETYLHIKLVTFRQSMIDLEQETVRLKKLCCKLMQIVIAMPISNATLMSSATDCIALDSLQTKLH